MRQLMKSILVAAATLALAALDAGAQTLTKMTIATGVDPAFSQFYVAKEAGLFEKNGLDVTINTGPSGSAMVPFLINNQVKRPTAATSPASSTTTSTITSSPSPTAPTW